MNAVAARPVRETAWTRAVLSAALAVLAEYPPEVRVILATIPIRDGGRSTLVPNRMGQWDGHSIWLFSEVFGPDPEHQVRGTLRHEYAHAMGMWHPESFPAISHPVHWFGGGPVVFQRGDSYFILPALP